MLNNKENKNQTSQKKSHIKLYFYLFLILLLVILCIVGYVKLKSYLDFKKEEPSQENFQPSLPINNQDDNSVNSNMISEYLQKQQNFQDEIYNKISELGNKIKESKENKDNSNNLNKEYSSKIALLEQKLTLMNNKQSYIKNISIILNLIDVLNSDLSFLNELDSFKETQIAHIYKQDILELSNRAVLGIPTSYSLANSLDEMAVKIKMANYKLDQSWLGRIKYYLSYLIVIQKNNDFKEEESSIDSTIYEIKTLLLNNNPEEAYNIASNHLCKLNLLENWCNNLKYRAKAHRFTQKLYKYLLNIQAVENQK